MSGNAVSSAKAAKLDASLTKPNVRFNPELDFMRAAAVLMVVFDHTALALRQKAVLKLDAGWLGVVGVVIFFVHTTLVLMWSLERKPYTLDFYIRRAFRIYPLAILAISIATLTHAPLTGTVDDFFQYHAITPTNFVATVLLVYNMAPLHLHLHPIVNVIGTLPLEVDMYLLLPALFVFATRVRSRWPIVILWLLACMTAETSGLAGGLTFITAVPCFLPGVLAYIGYARKTTFLPSWSFPVFLVAITSLLLLRPSVQTCWLFAFALGLGLPLFRSFRPSAFTKISNTVAKYSYGIYLSHPFGLWLGCYVLRRHSLPTQLAVECLTILVASVVSYHFLEEPMIRLGSRVAARVQQRALSGRGILPDHSLT